MTHMTMAEIAKIAGISRKYVSGILNDNPAIKVSAATRQRVLKLVAEHNYVADANAVALRTGRRHCIGVAASSSLGDMNIRSVSNLCAGIGAEAQLRNDLLTNVPLHTDIEKSIAQLTRNRMVDGIIIVIYNRFHQHFNERILPQLHAGSIPFVVVSRSDFHFDCPHVGFDAQQAGQQATACLLQQGAQDIVCIAHDIAGYGQDLRTGYAQTMTAASLPTGFHNVTDAGWSADSGYATACALLAEKQHTHKTAYVIYSQIFAEGFAAAMREHQQENVQIVALGDVHDNALLYRPQYNMVDTQMSKQGRHAARMLYGLIEGEGVPLREIIQPLVVPFTR